ncbi:DUF4307 domain-containing protein [Solihabitans fulvus]|uniref:DUF4307 domain-containing protein n=1 Tax=Solihabitans fulvus TaxID=1892852 RepID=UPI001CB7681E|nr:DUF4307 domain-containing protein [Solihabitans fulvus]
MTQSDVLADRYGSRAKRSGGRWTRWVLLGVGVVVGAVVAVVAYRNLGPQPIETTVTSFDTSGGDSVAVTFVVTRDQPERPAVCIVRARTDDGIEGGRREVYIPPGNGSVPASTVVHTSGRPTTGEVFGCSYQVPAYLGKN